MSKSLLTIQVHLFIFFLSAFPIIVEAEGMDTEARIAAMQQQMEEMSRE